MMNPKIATMLGFAMRSRNIDTGEVLCKRGIQTHKISLLFIASDISEETGLRMKALCDEMQVRYIDTYNRDELSQAIGKENRTLVGITSKKFSREILTLHEQSL